MPLNLELRNISHNERLSEETNAYSAKLYLDGKHIADVSNHGHGGCDNVYPAKGFTYQDIANLEAKIKATYAATVYEDLTIAPSLESVCGDLLTKWLIVRDLKRPMKKKVLYIEDGKVYSCGYKVPLTPDLLDKCKAHIAAKYPRAIILNGLSDDAIYAASKGAQ